MVCGLVPLFGYELDRAHLQRWVRAAQQANTKIDNKCRMIACVRLIKDGKTPIAGRVVIASPSATVVYDSATGEVRRESLGGISVQAVEF